MINRLWFASGVIWSAVLVETAFGIAGVESEYVHRVLSALGGVVLGCAVLGHIMVKLIVPRTVAAGQIYELGVEAGARAERERLRGMPVVVPIRRHCGADCDECIGNAAKDLAAGVGGSASVAVQN